jgi:serine/threonine protein kinase
MNPSATQPSVLSPVKPSATKFTHASGFRPLDGYTIKRGIGWGGFGEVSYATTDAGKECALKLIRRNLDIELRGVTQCLNLKHPNLLALFDIRKDEHDDTWIIMEFVSGESLEDVIARNPHGMPHAELLRWFDGLTAGVAYLHDHGIVHRDLKPGNIFSDEGIVKVGDYGLSKFISCSRRSGQTESVGTVHYMAPEIANGRYGKEIDVYALGVILYEMVTGHVPFDGESVGEVLMKHLTGEPNLDPLPEPFRTVVARSLTKNPEQRIRNVGEMRDLLAGNMPAERYGAHATSTLPPSERPSQVAMPWDAGHGNAGIGDSAFGSTIYPEPRLDSEGPLDAEVDSNPFREPIARAVYAGVKRLRQNWDQVQMPDWLKVLTLIAGAIAVLVALPFWFPALWIVAPVYGIYWVIRAMVVPPPAVNQPRVVKPKPRSPVMAERADTDLGLGETIVPTASDASPTAAHAETGKRIDAAESNLTRRERLLRRRRRSGIAGQPKSIRDKVTEATGSMLIAAVLSIAYSVIATLLTADRAPEARTFTWIAAVVMLGAWAVIVPGKLWEGRRGEQVGRRTCMMVFGMLVGLVAYALSSGFSLSLPYSHRGLIPSPHEISLMRGPMNAALYGPNGEPGLWAHAAFFAFLFLVPAWWVHSDGTRRRREKSWKILVATSWAYLLSSFWPYPHPWGIAIAAGISLVAQMASPAAEPRAKTATVEGKP